MRLHGRLPPAFFRAKCRRPDQGRRSTESAPTLTTITDLWPSANWYEREVWDMFGIAIRGPSAICGASSCRRPGRAIRCARTIPPAPPRWAPSSFAGRSRRGGAGGAALPSRGVGHGAPIATAPTSCSSTSVRSTPARTASSALFSSSTARRSSTPCRRSASTTAAPRRWRERQTWHTYIPYTDRIDYLGGVMNNLAYCAGGREAGRYRGAAAGADDPRHAGRILPHHQPPGLVRNVRAGSRRALAGLLHVQRPRARLHIIEAICGDRMHPNWFRIGGVAPGPARRAGTHGPRLLRLPAAAPARIRQDGHAATASSRRAPRASAAAPWTKRSSGA